MIPSYFKKTSASSATTYSVYFFITALLSHCHHRLKRRTFSRQAVARSTSTLLSYLILDPPIYALSQILTRELKVTTTYRSDLLDKVVIMTSVSSLYHKISASITLLEQAHTCYRRQSKNTNNHLDEVKELSCLLIKQFNTLGLHYKATTHLYSLKKWLYTKKIKKGYDKKIDLLIKFCSYKLSLEYFKQGKPSFSQFYFSRISESASQPPTLLSKTIFLILLFHDKRYIQFITPTLLAIEYHSEKLYRQEVCSENIATTLVMLLYLSKKTSLAHIKRQGSTLLEVTKRLCTLLQPFDSKTCSFLIHHTWREENINHCMHLFNKDKLFGPEIKGAHANTYLPN